jgi:hypothetical protein
MIVDKEEHKQVILLALRNMQITGAAGDPELLRHIHLVHEVLAVVGDALVEAPDSSSVVSLADR